MRSRLLAAVATIAVALVALAPVSNSSNAQAQEGQRDRLADGLIPGDYLRVGFSNPSPINPRGSIRDWNRGQGVTLTWENWAFGSTGVSRIGFALEGGYSLFPLDEQRFLTDFRESPNGVPIAATGKSASIIQLAVTTRLRIPAPFIMPSVGIGFGFLNWRPGKIDYTATNGSGTVRQQQRTGASLTLTGGLDKHILDRFAVFADASYTYAYTSFGSGLAASGSSCLSADCDLLKNTQLGVIRGGLRVRVGR